MLWIPVEFQYPAQQQQEEEYQISSAKKQTKAKSKQSKRLLQFSVVAELFSRPNVSSASVCPAKQSKNLEKKGNKKKSSALNRRKII